MQHRANIFGSFLQTMNAGKPDIQPFDREASAKLVLQQLSSRKAPAPRTEIAEAAGLTRDQAQEVIAYLVDAGMVEQLDGESITLSGFGSDALEVFAVS